MRTTDKTPARSGKIKASWLYLLAAVLLVLTVAYLLARPALIRAQARATVNQLGGYAYTSPYPPRNLYWKAVSFLPERFHPIGAIALDKKRTGAQLGFLRSIPELEQLKIPFHDASDELIADCVRNMRDIFSLDVAGTFAGQQTAQALLEHPSVGGGGEVTLNHCRVSRKSALDLRTTLRDAEVDWCPPLPDHERRLLQALAPAVWVTHDKQDWDASADLHVWLEYMEPQHLPLLAELSGEFEKLEIFNGTLHRELADSLQRGKRYRTLQLVQNTMMDPSVLRGFEGIESMATGDSCEFKPAGAGPCLPDSLRELWIYDTVNGLPRLVAGSSLETLKLWGEPSTATDSDLLGLGEIRTLQKVDVLGQQQLTDEGIEQLRSLQRLQHLNLTGATNLTDRSLAVIGTFNNMTQLELSGTKMTDAGLRELKNLNKLKHLSVPETGISDAGVTFIAPLLPELVTLNLYGTDVTEACLPSLAKLPRLKNLNIGKTSIEEIDPELLRRFPSLEQVVSNAGLLSNRAEIEASMNIQDEPSR